MTRLKKILSSIVHGTQMAFMEGRQIFDAVLIALEAVDKWPLTVVKVFF